jgi:predicted RNA-binding Zn-ribbon protein involved in translation (DUF1610 family)
LKPVVTYAALALGTLLLAAILLVLLDIGRHGIPLHVSGRVELANDETGVIGTVNLVMPDAVSLVATGPDEKPMLARLSVALCPQCGGAMVPVRWALLTGEITWRCLTCGYAGLDEAARSGGSRATP